MATPLTMSRTVNVGDRQYAYLYQVVPGDVLWYYMPYGVAHLYLNADARTLDWWELGRRYGVRNSVAAS